LAKALPPRDRACIHPLITRLVDPEALKKMGAAPVGKEPPAEETGTADPVAAARSPPQGWRTEPGRNAVGDRMQAGCLRRPSRHGACIDHAS